MRRPYRKGSKAGYGKNHIRIGDKFVTSNCRLHRENDEMVCTTHNMRWPFGEEHPDGK